MPSVSQEIWVSCKAKYQCFLVLVSSTRLKRWRNRDREGPTHCFVPDEEHHGEGPAADQQLLGDLAASSLF